jgi:hypothetical protein
MTEYNFYVEYHGKARISIEAVSIVDAQETLNDSCLLEDHAVVENNMEHEFDVVKHI